MKKYLLLIPLTLLITVLYFAPVKTNAATGVMSGWYIVYSPSARTYEYHILVYNFDHWYTNSDYPNVTFNKFYYCLDVFSGYKYTYDEAYDAVQDRFWDIVPSDYNITGSDGFYDSSYYASNNMELWIYDIPYLNLDGVDITDESNPPEPEPGDTWFDNMWDWFTDLLGLTDDFSEDLKNWMLEDEGGDGGHSGGHSFEVVTPTPSPFPTPFPSPTPFSIDVVDPSTGQPVYTITGIPGNTVIINQGDNVTNEGDGLDIFEVDLKIGDQGTSNPRDGINSVIDSGADYVSDIDTSSVGASFSILPNDWFVLIGVLICFPFIAGFISKLLK